MVAGLGLTSCLHREMSSLSSEGEGQNRPVPKRHMSLSVKETQVTKTKETGALTKEEAAETGNVSIASNGLGKTLIRSLPGAHEDGVAAFYR